MKQLLVIALIALASCNKQASNQLATEQMTYEQVSKLIGKENAFKVFDRAGLTESSPTARGRKVKAEATLTVWLNDLTLTNLGNDFTYTTSPNAEWASVQRFGAGMSMDGAYSVWDCNRWWSAYDVVPTEVHCEDIIPAGESNYRAFTSDKQDAPAIHISNIITIVQ